MHIYNLILSSKRPSEGGVGTPHFVGEEADAQRS